MTRQVKVRHHPSTDNKDERRKMIAKIQIEYPKLRPDLRHSTEELREARLHFCKLVLGLREAPTSIKKLTNKQLGRVIEAIKKEKGTPRFEGFDLHQVSHIKPTASVVSRAVQPISCGVHDMRAGEIIHLAGKEQVWAIGQILLHLGWSEQYALDFIKKRFSKATIHLLTHKEANSLTMVLLTIAASRDIKKEQNLEHVSRQMVRKYIPTLKRELGIDRPAKPAQNDSGVS